MGELEYKDQNVDALTLAISLEPVDASAFLVLEEKEIEFNGVRIRAGIIGSSNFWQVQTSTWQVSQVLTCEQPKRQVGKSLVVENIGSMQVREVALNLPEGVRFSGRYEITTDGSVVENTLAECSKLRNNQRVISMSYIFESPASSFQAATIVIIEFLEGGVCVRTLHSYPNEGKVVVTEETIFWEVK